MKKPPKEVLAFWFSEEAKPYWFKATPAFDQKVSDFFLPTYHAALEQKLRDWEATPEGALALVITLDQFPRNIFRGKAG